MISTSNQLLLNAAALNDLQALVDAIDDGADLNVKNPTMDSALHLAARKGFTDIVMTLLEACANVNIADDKGVCPIHLAAQRKHLKCLQALVKAKANVNCHTSLLTTPLMKAVTGSWSLATDENNRALVEVLLQARADPNSRNEIGRTPLHIAVHHLGKELTTPNQASILVDLITAGADPDARDTLRGPGKSGFTPLDLAANLSFNPDIKRRIMLLLVETPSPVKLELKKLLQQELIHWNKSVFIPEIAALIVGFAVEIGASVEDRHLNFLTQV